MRSQHRTLIEQAALAHSLDPDLLEAQVWVESGDQPWAYNPEPRYKYLWDVRRHRTFRALTPLEVSLETPPPDFPTLAGDPDQEWWAQQASWGLLQIMGAVAREGGFTGPYLPQLCDPAINLHASAGHLAGLVRWAIGNVDQALAAYNGGRGGNSTPPYRNEVYVQKVRAVHAQILSQRGTRRG